MSKFAHTLLISLEWRIIAFVITNIFLWITTGSFWTATGWAFILQVILFVAYTAWHFFRCELGASLHIKNKDAEKHAHS